MKKISLLCCVIILLITQSIISGDLGYIGIFVEGDVRLFVIDSSGNRAGYDPSTNQYYNDIPNFAHGPAGDEYTYGWDFASSQPYSEPFEESFEFNIIGMKRGKYILNGGFARQDNKGFDFESEGIIDSMEVIRYNFFYSTDTEKKLYFQLDMLNEFEKLIIYINNSYQTGSIDNKGIANSLISKIENAKKQFKKKKYKQVKNALNAFINELNAQRGKHINEDIYVYLYEKVVSLINHLYDI